MTATLLAAMCAHAMITSSSMSMRVVVGNKLALANDCHVTRD